MSVDYYICPRHGVRSNSDPDNPQFYNYASGKKCIRCHILRNRRNQYKKRLRELANRRSIIEKNWRDQEKKSIRPDIAELDMHEKLKEEEGAIADLVEEIEVELNINKRTYHSYTKPEDDFISLWSQT